MFNEYLSAQLNDTPLYTSKTKNTNESYRGIYKVDFPDWEGWKVIKMEKKAGVHVSKTYPLFGDEFAHDILTPACRYDHEHIPGRCTKLLDQIENLGDLVFVSECER